MNNAVALVTEGTRGIGLDIVKELAKTHRVLVTTRANADGDGQREAVPVAEVVACDVGVAEAREALVNGLRSRFARLDVLVNYPGAELWPGLSVLEGDEQAFHAALAAGLKGPYFLAQSIARWMIEQGGGRIVFVTPLPRFELRSGFAGHCVSTAGLSMACAIFARRLACEGIGVFEVRPGMDSTGATADAEPLPLDGALTPAGDPAGVTRTIRAIVNGELDSLAGQVLRCGAALELPSI